MFAVERVVVASAVIMSTSCSAAGFSEQLLLLSLGLLLSFFAFFSLSLLFRLTSGVLAQARTLLIPEPFSFSRGQNAPWTRRPRVVGKEMQRFSLEKVVEAIDQACLLLQRILTRTR